MDAQRIPGGARESLRIALVTETYLPEVNGVALTLARLVDGLRGRGHDVQVVRPRQGRLDRARQAPELSETLTAGLPIPGYPGLRLGLPCRRTLQRLWAANPPDIVHVATEGPLGMAAVAAASALGLPVSSGFHTNFHAYSSHYRLGWLRGVVTRHLRRFHNRTGLTLAPTEEVARQLTNDGYRNVTVLSRGVDTDLFNPRRRSPALRLSWSADERALVVAYVGRLAPEKNLSLVTATFDAISARHRDARLVFVGGGPLFDSLNKQPHPRWVFAGIRHGEDLATHYASADLFLFPSLTETFGNVVPEALASGLAVVAFDCAAAGDLIDDGVNGRVVGVGDGRTFRDTTLALADNRTMLAELKARSSTSVSHLGWDRIHDRFASLLAQLATNHRTWRGE